jgi:5,10-methylenetetrahydrofolate reductase
VIFSVQTAKVCRSLFPPKTDEQVENLMATVADLNEFEPDFYTCTYGAGGINARSYPANTSSRQRAIRSSRGDPLDLCRLDRR